METLARPIAAREPAPTLDLSDEAIDYLMTLDPLAPERIALARVLDDALDFGREMRASRRAFDATVKVGGDSILR